MWWFFFACGPQDGEPDNLEHELSDDTGTLEASDPVEGFGTLSGDCWMVDEAEWTSPDPRLFQNRIDLPGIPDANDLTEGGAEILEEGNLGGDSLYSEAFAFEVLARCEGAALLETEAEITYLDKGGKKTDLRVDIDGNEVGISVTRAFHYPAGSTLPQADADALMEDKLSDVLSSAANAAEPWARSLLHILAIDEQHADAVAIAFDDLDVAVLDQTWVVVTITDGDDGFLY